MQQPTCTNVRIRSTADAHKIFAAVQQGILHMVTRRLDADERIALRSGCVYAWEERGPHSELTGLGIERFTEGRRWSPSRVRDEFLFYYEKYSPPAEANQIGNASDRMPPRDWDPLVKQTYSVWVETEKGKRKWHLTAYFTQATIDQLGTIDENPLVRDLPVPDGMFKSTRVGKSRNKTDDGSRTDAARAATTIPRTYAPFPTPYQYQAQNGSPSMTPVLMHEPYRTTRVEEPSPVLEPSPSPDSFQDQGNYGLHQRSYSSLNNPPASTSTPPSYANRVYSPVPLAVSQPIDPHSHLPIYPAPGVRVVDRQSRTMPVSSPSWDEGNTSYYPRSRYPDDQRHEIASQYPMSSPASYMTSVDYQSNLVTSPQTYMPPGTSLPQLSTSLGNNMYSPSMSSSLHSALILPTQNNDANESYTLSPLQIPGRLHANVYSPSRSLEMQVHSEDTPSEDIDHEGSLAPLDVLRRPSRFRRDPMDEKTLRLLREKRSSS
ncbi:cAMP-independent regulatory protein pac2 [Psilocybe cubensis]|uniref:cAMP-independent regulatory protein pac2 n=2 Tax=Psilocybe cubensis TaxID=181762 RepID=A0A8H7Y7T7_PSICU|nr:cAMP-independent regulatory protein pac2 [Psilocybe cubensis]KAH9485085.1 cAMP-independent regulatory protein pac2 [Psilocybe cubensis]